MARRSDYVPPRFEAKHGAKYCKVMRACVECGKALPKRRSRWCSDACVTAYRIRNEPGFARSFVYDRDRGVCSLCGLDTTKIREEMKEADRGAYAEYLERWNRDNPEGIFSWLKSERVPMTNIGFAIGSAWSPEGVTKRKRKRGRALWGSHREIGVVVGKHRTARLIELGHPELVPWWWRKTYWDMDHIRPVDRGGGGCGVDNLRTLCVSCHSQRSAEETRIRSRGGWRRITRRPGEECEGESRCAMPNLCKPCERYRARARAVADSGRP